MARYTCGALRARNRMSDWAQASLPSTGTAVWAALEVGRELEPSDVVVVLVPDSGRGYLSKVYDEKWMADYGFLRSSGVTAGEVLARKESDIPQLVHVLFGKGRAVERRPSGPFVHQRITSRKRNVPEPGRIARV